jgi:hypothetical protein
MAATGTYRRQARLNAADRATLKAGVQRIVDRTGRPFNEVYAEQEEAWKADMRSESTEWSDPDSDEQYSGLADLSGAGWRVMGLDAGQVVTARQLEMRRISADLATAMAHTS